MSGYYMITLASEESELQDAAIASIILQERVIALVRDGNEKPHYHAIIKGEAEAKHACTVWKNYRGGMASIRAIKKDEINRVASYVAGAIERSIYSEISKESEPSASDA